MRNQGSLRRIVPAVAASCMLIAASPAPVAAQAARGTPSNGAASGKETYGQYCASCHGAQGKGDGPAAAGLKARPTDLTTLAKRKGGFSAAAVEAVIKGISDAQASEHEPIPVHGSYAMPVWGPYFKAVASTEVEAQRRVTSLVKFIESIQVK
jgi:cytochrome c553